ncbi:MAG: hypothetical protein SV487_07860, partial [Thermodesulfobacteriota bacterium]|nr:hypothetical protein [Thermodesulfobacteriota bacterium]
MKKKQPGAPIIPGRDLRRKKWNFTGFPLRPIVDPIMLGFEKENLNIQAVVFDFDGTLARLEIDFGLMQTRVLGLAERFGWRSSGFEGGYVLETMAAVKSDLTVSDPEAADEFYAGAQNIVESMEIEAAGRGGLFPDTRPVLGAFGQAGFKLALITRNFGAAVEQVFPDLADFFPVFLPRDSVARVKPDPLHLQTALQGL